MPLRRSLGCLEETEGHDDEDAREKSTDVPRRVRGRSRSMTIHFEELCER